VSRISREQVEHVARLARLRLGEAEAARLTADLDAILGYVAVLESLDTRGVEATAHPFPLRTPLRADRPGAPLDPDLALRNAPDRVGSAFRVPKVIEED
jgi:aspartyl-tRNA(Asn)/glutamyl-tRNA(Gln) amidotransferase subunit C